MEGKLAVVKETASPSWWRGNEVIIIEKIKKNLFVCREVDGRKEMVFYTDEITVK